MQRHAVGKPHAHDRDPMPVYVGVDVGATWLHCAAVDARGRVERPWVVPAFDRTALIAEIGGAEVVAVDAPAQPSTQPHSNDPSLSQKFRAARCAEIALGREHGSWVPWVSPAERPRDGWMAAGFAAYDALSALTVPVIEVFPYAGFRALGPGGRLPPKRTPAGRTARIELLARRGVSDDRLAAWSHDALDALLGALVALDYATGRARRVSCGHDDSAIWLPAAPTTK